MKGPFFVILGLFGFIVTYCRLFCINPESILRLRAALACRQRLFLIEVLVQKGLGPWPLLLLRLGRRLHSAVGPLHRFLDAIGQNLIFCWLGRRGRLARLKRSLAEAQRPLLAVIGSCHVGRAGSDHGLLGLSDAAGVVGFAVIDGDHRRERIVVRRPLGR